MSPLRIPAAERFSETELDNAIENGQASSLYTLYTCPSCQEKVRFSRTSFENRGRRETSNLSEEHAAAFAMAAEPIAHHEYLDWYCPGCKNPARVYFEHWAGGKHGDSGVSLVHAAELSKERSGAL